MNENGQVITRLVETYQVPIYTLCYQVLGDEQQAEEAAQAVFARICQQLKGLAPGADCKTLLFAVASGECLRRAAASANGSSAVQSELVRLLLKLSPEERLLTALRYGCGLTGEEMGKVLDIPAAEASARLRVAQRRLALALIEDHEGKTH